MPPGRRAGRRSRAVPGLPADQPEGRGSSPSSRAAQRPVHLELAGAAGLVLPPVTGIALWLTPLAAALLALVMVFAAVFHLRRAGEGMNAVMNVVLGALAGFVAYGRLVLAPYV